MQHVKRHQPKTQLASETEQEERDPSPLNGDVFSRPNRFAVLCVGKNHDEQFHGEQESQKKDLETNLPPLSV
jgi:hypothetical protein